MFDSKKTLSALAFAGLMCAPAFAAAPSAGTYNVVVNGTLASITVSSSGAYTGTKTVISTGDKSTLTSGTLSSGTTFSFLGTSSDLSNPSVAGPALSRELELPFNADAYVVKVTGTLDNDDYAYAYSAKDRALDLAEKASIYAAAVKDSFQADYDDAVSNVNAAYNSALASVDAVADKTIAKAVSTDDITNLTYSKETAASDVKDAEKDVADAKDAFKAAKTSEKASKQRDLSKANAELEYRKLVLKTATADLTGALALQKKVVDKYLSTSAKMAFNSLAKLKADSETASKKEEAAEKALASLVAARALFIQQATQFVSVANGDEGLILVTGVNATGTSFSYSGPAFSKVVASKKTGDVVVALNCEIASNYAAVTPENGLLKAGADLWFSGTNITTSELRGIATDKMTFKTAVTSTLAADGPFGAEEDDVISLKLSKGTLKLTNHSATITSSLTSNSGLVTGTVTINKKQVKVYGMAAKTTGSTTASYRSLVDKVSLIHSGIDIVDFSQ